MRQELRESNTTFSVEPACFAFNKIYKNTMDAWDITLLVTRLIFYLGFVGSIGGLLIVAIVPGSQNFRLSHIFHSSIKRYVLISTLLGFLGSAINFLALVGSFSDSGIRGMFDMAMIELLFDSNSGKEMQYRCLVFFLMSIFVAVALRNQLFTLKPYRLILWLIFSICLSSTFFISGHLFEANLLQKIVLTFHVLLAGFWIGSLIPLILICNTQELVNIKKTMQAYSKIASVFVPFLLILGGILTYSMISNWQEILYSNYARGLLIKLFLVISLLLIASRHKWFLVPKLADLDGLSKLKTSITIEFIIGVLVLVITAVITTVIGIDSTDASH